MTADNDIGARDHGAALSQDLGVALRALAAAAVLLVAVDFDGTLGPLERRVNTRGLRYGG